MNFWLSAKFTFKAEATVKRGAGFALSHLVNYGLQMIVLNVSLKFLNYWLLCCVSDLHPC